MTDQTDVRAAIDAGRELGKRHGTILTAPRHEPIMLVQNGANTDLIAELAAYKKACPDNIKRLVRFHEGDSFVAYVQIFRTDHTRVYFSEEGRTFEAVLDDHGPEVPSWCDHRAQFTAVHTPDWIAWSKLNRQLVPQAAFAEFIEERLGNVVEPDGARMMEIARSLQAHRTVEFQSSVHLGNGQVQFQYIETTEAGKQALSVPERLTVRLRPFLNGAEYDFRAAFRYRIERGGLTMGFAILGLENFLQNALRNIVEDLRDNLNMPIMYGEVVWSPDAQGENA